MYTGHYNILRMYVCMYVTSAVVSSIPCDLSDLQYH